MHINTQLLQYRFPSGKAWREYCRYLFPSSFNFEMVLAVFARKIINNITIYMIYYYQQDPFNSICNNKISISVSIVLDGQYIVYVDKVRNQFTCSELKRLILYYVLSSCNNFVHSLSKKIFIFFQST